MIVWAFFCLLICLFTFTCFVLIIASRCFLSTLFGLFVHNFNCTHSAQTVCVITYETIRKQEAIDNSELIKKRFNSHRPYCY